MTDQNPSTGAGNIKKFEITPNKGGEPKDISAAIVEYNYYESVMSNYISSNATVVETGNEQSGPAPGILDSLPIRGGEKSNIVVQDAVGNSIIVTGGLHVNRVRTGMPGSTKDIYRLDFASRDYFMNEQSRVIKRYEGKISDNVETILKDVLKTKSKIEVDETSLEYNFYGNYKKPFYICTWLASKSVPTKGTGDVGGFLFFQTRDGLYFKSIDDLFGKEAKKKYIFNDTPGLPPGYDEKILDYDIDSDIELDENLMMGAYNSQAYLFDYFKHEFTQVNLDINKQKGTAQTAGPDYVNVNPEFIEKPSRIMYHLMDYGVNPRGSGEEQLSNWRQGTNAIPNYDAQKTLLQTIMRYQQMFTVQTTITIPGDFTIKAGDMIECDFPQLEGKKNKENNKQTGGKYMVAHVCHRITPNDSFTRLGLVRDSFGKKGGGF